MLNLKKNTKIVISVFTILYVLAFMLSSLNISGEYSNLFCSILTLAISFSAFFLVYRAIKLAIKIERAPHWYTNCICRGSAIQATLCFSLYMFLLGSLKLWSVADLFIFHWKDLPLSYHAQSWAYLAENATSILLTWVVINMLDKQYKCAQKHKTFDNQIDITTMET